ncbi:Pr6Pr family membrane protein [Paratractidigestivibacter sp.]|uniref:Pr6Pr family membrane protein n=1 Tax=Paratractidigestivibacter sp. TaxID=2847316 RepID=UPI002AC90A13|nr:Pr6Pr family membrane protein [Paratractidigestivibacter sp.]
MGVSCRNASIIFKLALAVAGTIALIAQCAEHPSSFWYFFTHISNIAVVAYLYVAGIAAIRDPAHASRPPAPRVEHALILAITVTCLVAHFMLNGGGVFSDGAFHPQMLVMHYVVPVGMVASWLLFDEKGSMDWKEPPSWALFPLAYVAYIFVAVLGLGVTVGESSLGSGRWPYPFLDVDALGALTVALIIVALLVFFVAFGYLYVAIDHALARCSRRVSGGRV